MVRWFIHFPGSDLFVLFSVSSIFLLSKGEGAPLVCFEHALLTALTKTVAVAIKNWLKDRVIPRS